MESPDTDDPLAPPLDSATVAKLELDDSTMAHVHDLVEEAAPLHEDCLACRRLLRAIAEYEARTGEQLPIAPRGGETL